MEPWLPGAITGSLALAAAIGTGIITGVLQARRERNAHVRSSRSPGAPTVQEIWQRQDRMETAFRSALVILGEVAEQVEDPSALVLSRRHLDILAEGGYLPPEFDRLLHNTQ